MKDEKIMNEKDGTVIFYPHVPESAVKKVKKVLRSRWIGQGPKVDKFEKMFEEKFYPLRNAVALNSGTSALHLAYLLAGIGPGDEVIVPVFTCTATTIPLLWIGAKPVFADCNEYDLNISVDHVQQLITDKTRAIVCVHYGGLACNLSGLYSLTQEYNLPLIEDCAQALGTRYKWPSMTDNELVGKHRFACFSFQAIKHITTGDGGMLTTPFKEESEKAKRLRWFGIDRKAKQNGIWENDISEIGYKYQMTDISAVMGIEGLKEIDDILDHRRLLHNRYEELLGKAVIGCGDSGNSAWMCTILCAERKKLQEKLRANKIESGVVHYRNDQYSVFGKRIDLPNMNYMEDKYMVLPLHTHMGLSQVEEICSVINEGWY